MADKQDKVTAKGLGETKSLSAVPSKPKMFLLEPGFVEDTVIYELKPVEVARLRGPATIDEVEDTLDQLGVRQLVLDAGHPQIIERLRRKWFIHKLLRRKSPKPNATLSNLEGSSHMRGTPKAQGHEADNLSEGSAR